MVVHSYYPGDPRVRREAEALAGDGWSVDVVCLRGKGELATEDCGGVRVFRLPDQRHRGGGLAVYLLEYAAFFALASLRIVWLHLHRRYDVVQAHNMPDFLVFTGLIPRLLGARVVLDVHDLVPELFGLRFGAGTRHPVVGLTRWVERASVAFADHVVTAGEPFRRRLVEAGAPPTKVTVVMNSADPGLFRPVVADGAGKGGNGHFRLVYHGGLFERYGLDVAIRAVGQLREAIPGLRLDIYGEGEAVADLARLVRELGLSDRVRLRGYVPIDQIPGAVVTADLGVVPYRRNYFTDLLYPTKAFEYIALGVPVIVSRTAAVAALFAAVPEMFFEPDDVDGLAARILALYREPERRERMLLAASAAYSPYAWESQRERYVALMRRLAAPHRSPAPEHD
jgi:glycosyltransferase involved in cell wall biosynthesis